MVAIQGRGDEELFQQWKARGHLAKRVSKSLTRRNGNLSSARKRPQDTTKPTERSQRPVLSCRDLDSHCSLDNFLPTFIMSTVIFRVAGKRLARSAAQLSQRRRNFATPSGEEFTEVVPKPYPYARNFITVGLIGSFVVGSYYWTLSRMKSGNEELMEELDDLDAGYTSAGKDMGKAAEQQKS